MKISCPRQLITAITLSVFISVLTGAVIFAPARTANAADKDTNLSNFFTNLYSKITGDNQISQQNSGKVLQATSGASFICKDDVNYFKLDELLTKAYDLTSLTNVIFDNRKIFCPSTTSTNCLSTTISSLPAKMDVRVYEIIKWSIDHKSNDPSKDPITFLAVQAKLDNPVQYNRIGSICGNPTWAISEGDGEACRNLDPNEAESIIKEELELGIKKFALYQKEFRPVGFSMNPSDSSYYAYRKLYRYATNNNLDGLLVNYIKNKSFNSKAPICSTISKCQINPTSNAYDYDLFNVDEMLSNFTDIDDFYIMIYDNPGVFCLSKDRCLVNSLAYTNKLNIRDAVLDTIVWSYKADKLDSLNFLISQFKAYNPTRYSQYDTKICGEKPFASTLPTEEKCPTVFTESDVESIKNIFYSGNLNRDAKRFAFYSNDFRDAVFNGISEEATDVEITEKILKTALRYNLEDEVLGYLKKAYNPNYQSNRPFCDHSASCKIDTTTKIPDYNLFNINKLLLNGYDDQELNLILFYHPEEFCRTAGHLNCLYDEVKNLGKAEKVYQILKYAYSSQSARPLKFLLDYASVDNPSKYEVGGPYCGQTPWEDYLSLENKCPNGELTAKSKNKIAELIKNIGTPVSFALSKFAYFEPGFRENVVIADNPANLDSEIKKLIDTGEKLNLTNKTLGYSLLANPRKFAELKPICSNNDVDLTLVGPNVLGDIYNFVADATNRSDNDFTTYIMNLNSKKLKDCVGQTNCEIDVNTNDLDKFGYGLDMASAFVVDKGSIDHDTNAERIRRVANYVCGTDSGETLQARKALLCDLDGNPKSINGRESLINTLNVCNPFLLTAGTCDTMDLATLKKMKELNCAGFEPGTVYKESPILNLLCSIDDLSGTDIPTNKAMAARSVLVKKSGSDCIVLGPGSTDSVDNVECIQADIVTDAQFFKTIFVNATNYVKNIFNSSPYSQHIDGENIIQLDTIR